MLRRTERFDHGSAAAHTPSRGVGAPRRTSPRLPCYARPVILCCGRAFESAQHRSQRFGSASRCTASQEASALSGRSLEASAPSRRSRHAQRRVAVHSGGADALVPLGLDFLTFLCATVLVIPVFKSVGASPVLGFLFSGLLLGQLGLVPPLYYHPSPFLKHRGPASQLSGAGPHCQRLLQRLFQLHFT